MVDATGAFGGRNVSGVRKDRATGGPPPSPGGRIRKLDGEAMAPEGPSHLEQWGRSSNGADQWETCLHCWNEHPIIRVAFHSQASCPLITTLLTTTL